MKAEQVRLSGEKTKAFVSSVLLPERSAEAPPYTFGSRKPGLSRESPRLKFDAALTDG